MLNQLISSLNPEQRAAVEHVDGPLLVLAGAGSGKTRVLTVRIANLVANHGVPPHAILALTFTNKAAGEMRRRVEDMLGQDLRGMFVGTFHSFGAQLLRRHAGLAGWPTKFTILDGDQSLKLMRKIMADRGLSTDRSDPGIVRAIISNAKNSLEGPEDLWQRAESSRDFMLRLAAAVYPAYEAELEQQGAVDFDDLLVRPIRLFETHEDLLGRYQRRFRYILVDEYQDTNQAQYRLLALLARTHRNLMVVGDDDQAIYGWRGADIRNILEFESDFPGARIIRLEQNYRSTGAILRAANTVIRNNTSRKGKELWTAAGMGDPLTVQEVQTDWEEADFVAREVLRLLARRYDYRDIAILYRTNAQSRVLEDALRRSRIPYRIVGGTRFYDRREIRDVMAYLRMIVNPNDREAFERAVNWPRRGVGDASQEKLVAWARAQGVSLIEAARRAEEVVGITKNARKGLLAFAELILKYRQRAEWEDVGRVLRDLVVEAGILDALRAEKDGGVERAENVEELIAAAVSFDPSEYAEEIEVGASSVELFVQHVALLTDVDDVEEGGDAITLMTLHASKGLEFPVVFIAGVEEGIFPHAQSVGDPNRLEEERRLFYVGITRAQKKLYLTWANSRWRGYEIARMRPSRFLDELPPDVVEARWAA